MKKNDLKALIKPLVKECVQEALLEEGLLSNVVSEVVKGMQTAPIMETKKQQPETSDEQIKERSKKLNQQRKKMMEAIGSSAYNGVDLFEGTTPTPAQTETAAGSVDLGSPGDSGVDISSLMGGASKIWDAMK
jgi:hypothetical protein